MNDLGRACGLDLAIDDGRSSLLFDDRFNVTFEALPRDEGILLHAKVAGRTTASDPEVLRKILSASVLGARTDGAAFGISPYTGDIILWERVPEPEDYPALEAAINRFLAQADFWSNALQNAESDAAAEPQDSAEFSHIPPAGIMV